MTEPSFALTFPPEFINALAAAVAERLDGVSTTVDTDRWLDVDGAAQHIAAPKSRVYDLVRQGRLTPGRDGRRLVFRRYDLDDYLTNGAGG